MNDQLCDRPYPYWIWVGKWMVEEALKDEPSRITDAELAMIISASFVWFQIKPKPDLAELRRNITKTLQKVGVEVAEEK